MLFFIPFPFLKYPSLASEVAREGEIKSFPLLDCLKRQSYSPKNNQGIRNRSLGEIQALARWEFCHEFQWVQDFVWCVGQLLKLSCSWAAVVPAASCSVSQNNHFDKVFTTYKYGIGPVVSTSHYRGAVIWKHPANASLKLFVGVIFSCSFKIDDGPLRKRQI